MKINLGDRVRDKISGFSGVAIARTEWLHGCVRIVVQSEQLHEGKPVEPQHFDEPQVELVTAEPEATGSKKRPGGPRPAPRRQPDPVR